MAAVALFLAAMGAAGAADIAALERQLEEARNAAPITVEPFVISSKAADYFGDYDVRKDAVFRSGEQMHFYAEPKNLVLAKNAKGIYNVSFVVDLEVTAADGRTMKQPEFAKIKLDSRSRIQDLFLKLDVALTKAPAGKYNVKFTIRDQNSKKSLDFAKEVTIK
jgi:hypothetical protein